MSDRGPALAAVVLAGVLALPIVFGGPHDLGSVAAFSPDEVEMARRVRVMAATPTASPAGFFNYPTLYLYLAAAPLVPSRLAGELPTESAALVSARLVSCLAALLLVLAAALRSRAALACGLLVATSTAVVSLAGHASPDTLHALLLFAAIEAAGGFLWLASAAFSGFAAGAKYGGVFSMVVLLVLLCRELTRPRLSRLRTLAACCAVFVACFFATTPYALLDAHRFLQSLEFERSHIATGHFTRGDAGLLPWLPIAADGLSWGALILAAAGLVCGLVRGGADRPREARFWWMAVYGGYLAIGVRFHQSRYILPLVGALSMEAAEAIASLGSPAARGWALAAVLAPQLLAASELSLAALHRASDTRLAAGAWLESRVSRSRRGFHDVYTGMPAAHARCVQGWGVTEEAVKLEDYDHVVANLDYDRRYLEVSEPSQVLDPGDWIPKRDFYRKVWLGSVPRFRVATTFSPGGGLTGPVVRILVKE